MKRIIFILILAPLIRRNYKLREQKKLPDKWYWADKIAIGWGFWVE